MKFVVKITNMFDDLMNWGVGLKIGTEGEVKRVLDDLAVGLGQIVMERMF